MSRVFGDTSTNPPKNLGMGHTPPPFLAIPRFSRRLVRPPVPNNCHLTLFPMVSLFRAFRVRSCLDLSRWVCFLVGNIISCVLFVRGAEVMANLILVWGSNFDVTGISIMSGLVCEGPGVMAALASVPGSESAFGGHHDKRPNQPMLLGHNHIKHQAFWVRLYLYTV